jgi:hypothetical protein
MAESVAILSWHHWWISPASTRMWKARHCLLSNNLEFTESPLLWKKQHIQHRKQEILMGNSVKQILRSQIVTAQILIGQTASRIDQKMERGNSIAARENTINSPKMRAGKLVE